MLRKPKDKRMRELIICAAAILITAIIAVVAITRLTAFSQLPVLVVALAVLIFIARRVASIEETYRKESLASLEQMLKFREDNK